MNNYRKNRNILVPLVVAIVTLFSLANTSYALSISPVRIEVSGNPGETITKEITLINESEGNVTYYSSYANFEASGDTGNPSFVEPKDDIGTWMDAPGAIILKPQESKKVEVSIKIPNNAEPGGHFGAVFWGTSPNNPNSGVSIGAKTGVLVLLSVNGDVKEAGGLVDFGTKDDKVFYNTLPVTFIYRFRNDGGDRIKPVGKITMRNLFFIPTKIDANPTSGNILPNSTRKFEVNWVKNPRAKDYVEPTGILAKFADQAMYQWRNFAIGPYFTKINLLYGTEAIRVTKSKFIFIFPWQLIICLVVIFIIVWWGGRKIIRRYNRHIIRKAQASIYTSGNKRSDE
jgi:hypothetical protein